MEICIVSVCLSDNKQITVICAYRSPSTDIVYFNNLCNLITETARKYPNAFIYCAGDFNLPDIDWSNESINSHRYPLLINQRALGMMHDCSFAQIVNFPTRNDNILDLLFTNRPTLVQECYSTPGISDYKIIAATVES